MRIRVGDIEEAPREFSFEEPTGDLNPLLDGPGSDYQLRGAASAKVNCYRASHDLFFSGEATSLVMARCARCAESYEFELSTPLDFVLLPRDGRWTEEELEAQDVDSYDGEEIDLSPLVRERVLLSLPTLPLCREDCRGLCSRCGTNLNTDPCGCVSEQGDPRLAVLRSLTRARSEH